MTLARASQQLSLLSIAPSINATSNASARNAYGSAAQEIVCAALDIRPIPINGNCEVCFDAESPAGFFEIKSVRRGAKVVIYDWRMSKEACAGVTLYYAILIHQLKGQREQILEAMIAREPEILVLPAELVHTAARLSSKRTHQSAWATGTRNGYTRAGYCDGYRNVSISQLMAMATCYRRSNFDLYGVPRTVSVYAQS